MAHQKRRMHLFGRHEERGYVFRIFVKDDPAPHFFIRVVRPRTGELIRETSLPPLLYGGEGGIMAEDHLALEEKLNEISDRLRPRRERGSMCPIDSKH